MKIQKVCHFFNYNHLGFFNRDCLTPYPCYKGYIYAYGNPFFYFVIVSDR